MENKLEEAKAAESGVNVCIGYPTNPSAPAFNHGSAYGQPGYNPPPSYGQPGYNPNPGYTQNPDYSQPQGYNSNPGYGNPGYGNPPPFSHHTPQYQPHRPLAVEAPQRGWCDSNYVNKPQSNSIGAACMLFISGGMNMAWSFNLNIYISVPMTPHLRSCWFIAAIIGALFGAVLTHRVSRKMLSIFASLLVLIGGILFATMPRDAGAITAVRYLDGFGNGLIVVPTLVIAGEQAVRSVRGMLASTAEMMCFSIGIYMELIFSSSMTGTANAVDNVAYLHGGLSILYAALALLFSSCLIYESPVDCLQRGDEAAAIEVLRRLQRPFTVTTETYILLDEHKRYVAANAELSCAESARRGLPALLKLCVYRALNALTLSSIVGSAFLLTVAFSYGTASVWPFVLLGTMRWIGVMISAMGMDTMGRRKPMLLGLLVVGALSIACGVLLEDAFYLIRSNRAYTLTILMIVAQFFAGIAAPASSVYLTEAFPTAVKPFYIAAVFIVEMLVQIIICVVHITIFDFPGYFYATAGIAFAFFLVGVLSLPETKQKTLLDAWRQLSEWSLKC